LFSDFHLPAFADFLASGQLLAQLIGFAGFSFIAVSYQLLKPRNTILCKGVGDFVLIFHFLLLGQLYLSYIMLIASIRDFSSALGSERVKNAALAGFLVLLCVGFIFHYETWIDVAAVIGSILMTAAQYFRDRFYAYRFLTFGQQVLWLVIYIFVFSLGGIMLTVINLLSNIIGIGRYVFLGRKRKQPTNI